MAAAGFSLDRYNQLMATRDRYKRYLAAADGSTPSSTGLQAAAHAMQQQLQDAAADGAHKLKAS